MARPPPGRRPRRCEPPVAVDRSSSASRSTSMSIAPARASATTSCSSGSVPQLGLPADHSIGRTPMPVGNVPPPSPTMQRWPPAPSTAAARRKRLVRADEVEDEHRSPEPASPANVAGSSPSESSAAVGARVEREPPRALARVDRDDARRGEPAQQLHRHVPEPADADDDDARAGDEAPELALDRVVRRERRRRSAARPPRGRGRRAARAAAPTGTSTYSARPPSRPRPQPPDRRALAEVLRAARAVPADAAAPRPVDEHAVAFVERRDALAERPRPCRRSRARA